MSNTEQQLEDFYIQTLESKGWRFVPADNLERESLEEPLLVQTLERAIKRIANDERVQEKEIRQALNELKFRGHGIEDTKKILHFIKHGIDVKLEKDRTVKNLALIDYENMKNNEFIVSRQVIHKQGEKTPRNDIILYVNGVPLVNIELKDPASPTESWEDAFKDIQYYQQNIPELYKYVQVGIAAAANAKYFPICADPKPNEWKENGKDAIFEFLKPRKILDVIQNYLFFWVQDNEQTKVIARYMQYRASEKIFDRVIAGVESAKLGTQNPKPPTKDKDYKRHGLVWHWQGSGKTLTMIFAANKLYWDSRLENPTIFFIVDRDELEQQLDDELGYIGIQKKAEKISSVNHLKEVLEFDGGRGKKGLFLTLIHKFRPEELAEFSREMSGIGERKNVICFIDEGHRTQYGSFASVRKAILSNSFAFAFTGTPVKKGSRDTYAEFSYPPEEPYLDKYFMKESQEDGFTLKIVYQPKLEKGLALEREELEAFYKMEEDELDDLDDESRKKIESSVRNRLNRINVVLEDEKRINKTAKDAVLHFKEHIDGKFKAMLVVANKKLCVRYKRELDKLLPENYSEVVMSYSEKKESKEVQEYMGELSKRFGTLDCGDINAKIKDRFKKEEYPKIVIVTDMLLAGYDVPKLQTMYLVKPMKGGKLLQAIARTNRPYKGVKQAGLVIDYVGILREIDRAFEEYETEDWQGSCENLDELAKDFERLILETVKLIGGLPKNKASFTQMNDVLRLLMSHAETRQKFEQNCRKLMGIYEVLSSEESKARLHNEYKWVIQVYRYYQNQLETEQSEDARVSEKYFEKTLKLIHESIELQRLRQDQKITILDKNYIEELEKRAKDAETKAANIVFQLNRYVLVERQTGQNPVIESVTDKVQRIVQQWRDKTETMEAIYSEAVKTIGEINRLENRKEKLGFSNLEYSLLTTLESEFGEDRSLVEDARDLGKTLAPNIYDGWLLQQTARKNVEREIRVYLRKYVKKYGKSISDLEPIYQKLVKSVREYAAA